MFLLLYVSDALPVYAAFEYWHVNFETNYVPTVRNRPEKFDKIKQFELSSVEILPRTVEVFTARLDDGGHLLHHSDMKMI